MKGADKGRLGVSDRSVTTSFEEVAEELADYIFREKLQTESGIVYCATKLECETISTYFQVYPSYNKLTNQERELNSLPYHSKMTKQVKREAQQKWMSGEVNILCSTVVLLHSILTEIGGLWIRYKQAGCPFYPPLLPADIRRSLLPTGMDIICRCSYCRSEEQEEMERGHKASCSTILRMCIEYIRLYNKEKKVSFIRSIG